MEKSRVQPSKHQNKGRQEEEVTEVEAGKAVRTNRRLRNPGRSPTEKRQRGKLGEVGWAEGSRWVC